MKRYYRTIDDVLRSPWAEQRKQLQYTDRVLRATRLEDSIYEELRAEDDTIAELIAQAGEKLRTFPALARDLYQSFYSLMPRRNDASKLSGIAQKCNRKILDHVMESEDYAAIKRICEGRELPAYEAASEFTAKTAEELDELLEHLGNEKGALRTLEKLQYAQNEAAEELNDLLAQIQNGKSRNETVERTAVDAANRAESKRRQAEAVGKLIESAAAQKKEAVVAKLVRSVKAAAQKAEEVQSILGAWSDEPGNMERTPANLELLSRVRANPALHEISRYLGRFREIFAKGRQNGYAYGRGEKYALELGNDLSRALTSELAMLALPATTPLFLRNLQQKRIKQYQRRQPIYKGAGDIICCLDESGSTKGDAAAWGKAVALTLLEIAASAGRRFALIHFSGAGDCRTDLFLPGHYRAEDKMAAAETFLGGGTDFETPLRQAVSLLRDDFENADIVFITDGCCELPASYAAELAGEQAQRGFTVTGVLLDADRPGAAFSLSGFCRTVYRTSELFRDDIVEKLVSERV